MSALTMDLDNALAGLAAEDARRLEDDVRVAIRRAQERKREGQLIEKMFRERKPELLPYLGVLADVPFEAPEDPPPPPLEDW